VLSAVVGWRRLSASGKPQVGRPAATVLRHERSVGIGHHEDGVVVLIDGGGGPGGGRRGAVVAVGRRSPGGAGVVGTAVVAAAQRAQENQQQQAGGQTPDQRSSVDVLVPVRPVVRAAADCRRAPCRPP
jgi:hypothetical protein